MSSCTRFGDHETQPPLNVFGNATVPAGNTNLGTKQVKLSVRAKLNTLEPRSLFAVSCPIRIDLVRTLTLSLDER